MPLQWDHEISIKKKTIYFACCAQQFLTITRAAMHLRPSVLNSCCKLLEAMEAAPDDEGLKHPPFMGYLSDIYL